MSIPEKKFIDIWLQTYPADNPDRKHIILDETYKKIQEKNMELRNEEVP